MRWLWVFTIGVRLLAAALLVGPATDSASELDGWDAERFQAIADAPGQPYVDHEVEYPPGTVLLIEVLAGDDVVATNRAIVVASLAVDLALAALLTLRSKPAHGVGYLLLGTALVPTGLLRFDLWAALFATIGALALLSSPVGSTQPAGGRSRIPCSTAEWVFAVAVVVGAFIKLWPALLIAAAIAVGRWRPAVLASVLGAVAAAAWLAVSGGDALTQILSLRGATGWHVESVPGTLTSLLTDDVVTKEADAFRIGTLNTWVVTSGRVATFVLVVALIVRASRSNRSDGERLALVMVGSVAALLVTAPLLSPQFLLWLTPWAALLAFRDHQVLVGLTTLAIVITAGTLAAFGPPDLDHPVAATLLLVRNLLLVAIIARTWQTMTSPSGRRTNRLLRGG